MGFEITPIREFVVRPALPPSLSRLPELAFNFLWSWDHNLRALFRRLDPALWRSCHNPVLMLNQLSQSVLDKAAADPRYLALYKRACNDFDNYLRRVEPVSAFGELIAYFSMEYGLADCMPIYSGGLGVLSGDHLKASSDASIPLVAVGLLYQKGYLQQSLNPDGWQIERTPVNDFFNLPVQPALDASGNEARVQVRLPGADVHIKVWLAEVGRIKLFLLDTNVPENLPEHRDITEQLYGGDHHTRIRQEIVLGMGGLRTLKALGLEPTVFHMNEGHSAFLALERIRDLMKSAGMTFAEAHEATRVNNVFTTHTSVPAGIDLFDSGVLWEYFRDYCFEAGITAEQFFSLGRANPQDPTERFSMAITAMKASAYRNAVSRLHAEVSQEMWRGLWPDLPVWEVPITSVTNGVHLPTFLNGDLATLYDSYLQPDWRERYNEPYIWEQISDIPDDELWQAHRRRKRQLVAFIRERKVASAYKSRATAAEVRRQEALFDPDVFTIGFARRFATYKRATLLYRDVERLKKLLTNAKMPVQIVVAGKAHPKDIPGKTFIREIVQLTRDPEIGARLVFLEDYSIEVAKQMVQGVDLWLNNPKRGEEACGTSGMKAAINGVLNLSILDGWYDEAFEVSGGWAIGDREPYSEDQDDIHATSIYSLLENEILPMYYHRSGESAPKEWIARMKQCLRAISPRFNAQRMIHEYMQLLYQPAHDAWRQVSSRDFAPARERADWARNVERNWDRVRFTESETPVSDALVSGQPITVEGLVDLAGLRPEDVRVEVVVGRVGVSGKLEDTEVVQLKHDGSRNGSQVFAREFVPNQTGRLGYAIRVAPNHFDDPLTRPCHPLIKWSR